MTGISPTLARAAAVLLLLLMAAPSADGQATRLFDHAERVTLRGYDGHATEPFVTRDGRYLLFNNLNDPSVDTNLHFAERIDDLTFQYKGELKGVNTPALEGVPMMDRRNTVYFVSPRSYDRTYSTIYRGTFSHGEVSGIELVPGVSRQERGIVNFDVEVSPDGNTLYFVDARFGRSGPESADIVIAQRSGEGFQLTALEGFVEAPTLSPDERSLYYHKKEGAKFVIYRASR